MPLDGILAEMGGFYREVRIPNLCGDLPFGDALGPDLPPPRPRRASHPLPYGRGQPAGRRDRRTARPPSLDDPPRAGPEPLPRRRPRLLRLLSPERPGPGAAAPAAPPQAGRRRGLARARHRAPGCRLVAPADRRTAETGTGPSPGLPRDDLAPRLRPRGPRGRPPPPPAQGPAAAWQPLRPPAPP